MNHTRVHGMVRPSRCICFCDDTLFEVLNRGTANQARATVVGYWAGGDSAYKPSSEIVWPGGVTPDYAARVIRVLVPLPFTGEYTTGKARRRSMILHITSANQCHTPPTIKV